MTKAPTPKQNNQKAAWQYKKDTKNFDLTSIVDRLRTVSWSNNSHLTGVVKPVYEIIKPVYEIPFSPLTAKAV